MRPTRPCSECNSTFSLKKSSLAFEREGLQIRIEGLWTYVCPNGHESVPGPVAINVMNLVDQVFQATQHLQQAVNYHHQRWWLLDPANAARLDGQRRFHQIRVS